MAQPPAKSKAHRGPSQQLGNWRHRAACRDQDPETFFVVGADSDVHGRARTAQVAAGIAQAKAVCNRCPASVDCLLWALATRQDYGVWGGLAEDERRSLLRLPETKRRVILRRLTGRRVA